MRTPASCHVHYGKADPSLMMTGGFVNGRNAETLVKHASWRTMRPGNAQQKNGRLTNLQDL